MKYDIKELKANWDKYPNIRIGYEVGEAGWAKQLPDGNVMLANEPFAEGIHFMDVVKVKPGDHLDMVGTLVWRPYDIQTYIKYEAKTDEEAKTVYSQIHKALSDRDLPVEGFTIGFCAVSHTDDSDIEAILKDSGMDMDLLQFQSKKRTIKEENLKNILE